MLSVSEIRSSLGRLRIRSVVSCATSLALFPLPPLCCSSSSASSLSLFPLSPLRCCAISSTFSAVLSVCLVLSLARSLASVVVSLDFALVLALALALHTFFASCFVSFTSFVLLMLFPLPTLRVGTSAFSTSR